MIVIENLRRHFESSFQQSCRWNYFSVNSNFQVQNSLTAKVWTSATWNFKMKLTHADEDNLGLVIFFQHARIWPWIVKTNFINSNFNLSLQLFVFEFSHFRSVLEINRVCLEFIEEMIDLIIRFEYSQKRTRVRQCFDLKLLQSKIFELAATR